MAFEAASPLGIPWVYVGWLVSGVLVSLVLWIVLFGGLGWLSHPRHLGVVVMALFCAGWTAYSVAQPVTVPSARDPDGSTCVMDAHGENPKFAVDWASECGQAFRGQLVKSLGPSAVMMVVIVGLRVDGQRRVREVTGRA